MMDTENTLAVDANGGIVNANLYFFSWASLVTTISLLVGYGREANLAIMNSSNIASSGYWAGICVASLVVLVSSIQLYFNGVVIQGEQYVCKDNEEGSEQGDHGSGYCERLEFSIALGAIGTFVAGICSVFSFKVSKVVNASVSFVMLFLWALGVAFVTFGDKSPGNGVGNLYFSSWAAFVMSLFMVSTTIKDFLAARDGRVLGSGEEEKEKDIPSNPSSDTETKAEERSNKPEESPLNPPLTVPDGESKPEEVSEAKIESDAPVSNIDVPVPV